MENYLIDTSQLMRMSLVFLHLLCMIVASIGIAFSDYAVFSGQNIDVSLFGKSANAVLLALVGLWLSGLALIGIDTHFVLEAITAKPKLLAKLSVVTLLSINGIALHVFAFQRICQPQRHPRSASRLPVILGGISIASWFYAAFLGLAKPLASLLGYGGFMLLYVTAVACAIGSAFYLVRPRLMRRIVPA